MCSSNNLTFLVLTMWPTLEKLRFNVALLAGMQRYFPGACATIGYLRDVWTQYLREDVLQGKFILTESKSLTSRSILSIPSQGSGLPPLLGSMYLPYTKSRSPKAWIEASHWSVGRALLPSGVSSSLSSSLNENKRGPPYRSSLFALLSKFRDMRPTGFARSPTNGLGHFLAHK